MMEHLPQRDIGARRRLSLLVCLLAIVLLVLLFREPLAPVTRQASVQLRLKQYGAQARKRLAPDFTRAKVSYPPARIVLVGLKQEQELQLYAAARGGTLRYIRTYPILGASGQLGPKLREGDLQVPEGIYRIELLNPNSAYHLSLRVNYPNAFDRAMAKEDGRTNLGGDIMIHGGTASIGCLAMGDPASEDLFVLAHDVGLRNTTVNLSPVDFRVRDLPKRLSSLPSWIGQLYGHITQALQEVPKAPDR